MINYFSKLEHLHTHMFPLTSVLIGIMPGSVTCPLGPPDGLQMILMEIPKLNDPSAQ